MKKVVLDAWAIMALINGEEPAAAQVKNLFQQSDTDIYCSTINLGEVYYIIARKKGVAVADKDVEIIGQLPISFILPDRQGIINAARWKSQHRMSYADAFAASLAVAFDATLWTGDSELIVLGSILKIKALRR